MVTWNAFERSAIHARIQSCEIGTLVATCSGLAVTPRLCLSTSWSFDMNQFSKRKQHGQSGRDDKQSHGSSGHDRNQGKDQNPSHSGQTGQGGQGGQPDQGHAGQGGRGGQSGHGGQGGNAGQDRPERSDEHRQSPGQQSEKRKGDPAVNRPPSESPERRDRHDSSSDEEQERGIRPGQSEDDEPDDGKRPGR
jgi:hypothetical protein